jgi:urease accessory protein
LARALAPSAERLEETAAQGAAFARTVAALTGRTLAPRPLPVAVGEAAAGLGLDPVDVVALYLHAFAANLVTIAVRHVPLGQTEGQKVLAGMHPLIRTLAAARVGLPLDAIGTAAIRADLAAIRHETMDVRIFRT